MGRTLWSRGLVRASETTPGLDHAIDADRVTKAFGSRTAVDDVTFAVPRGEIVGLVGPNGAGKTTLIRLVLGLLAPTAGDVRVFGERSSCATPGVRRRVASVLERHGIYSDLTVRENLLFYGRLYRVPDLDGAVNRVLTLVGLAARANERAGRLSKGMKQKLAIGRCLLWDAELLVLDEPTSGLDPLFQKDSLDFIRQLGASGRTVLLSSHNLQEVQDACSTVVILHEGRLLAFDRVEALLARYVGLKKRIVCQAGADRLTLDGVLASIPLLNCQRHEREIEVLAADARAADTLEHALVGAGQSLAVTDVPVTLTDVFLVLVSAPGRSDEA